MGLMARTRVVADHAVPMAMKSRNNAGMTKDNLAIRLKPEDWEAVLRTNLDGAFYCIHAVMPAMLSCTNGVLLAIPVVALLWVSSYAKRTPELWGFPFFYWYQLMLVFLSAILVSICYRLVSA